MTTHYEEIRVRGKDIAVPAAAIQGRTIVATGSSLKVAAAKDEELIEGGLVSNPVTFITDLKTSGLRADILTFPQAIVDSTPQFNYPYEMDNAAVASTSNFEEWWESLPQETRKNARRAAKKGVVIREVELDDDLVAGIKHIYDETPMRQGMRFWHYGKDLDRVRLENATYLERSKFIGAYFEGELIGFMKWVSVGQGGLDHANPFHEHSLRQAAHERDDRQSGGTLSPTRTRTSCLQQVHFRQQIS